MKKLNNMAATGINKLHSEFTKGLKNLKKVACVHRATARGGGWFESTAATNLVFFIFLITLITRTAVGAGQHCLWFIHFVLVILISRPVPTITVFTNNYKHFNLIIT